MSISDKQKIISDNNVTIGKNTPLVYNAGYEKGREDGVALCYTSEGLAYSNDACSGIGTCTDTDIIVAPLHNRKIITNIGGEAFYNNDTITSITLPPTITNIGINAFASCSKLTFIRIPHSVIMIDADAFKDCNLLERVYITDLSEWFNISFAGQKSTPLCTGASLMVNGVQLRDLVVPEEVTAIGQYAFYQTGSLQSVTLHDGVTSVGTAAFNNCSRLKTVHLSAGLKTINRHAFWNCRINHEIELPATVVGIGKRAFGGGYALGLKRVTFKGTPTGTINSLAFNSTSITDIFVPWWEGAVANAPWGATNATIHYNWEV